MPQYHDFIIQHQELARYVRQFCALRYENIYERFGKEIRGSDEDCDRVGDMYGDEDKDTRHVANVVSMQTVDGVVGLSRARIALIRYLSIATILFLLYASFRVALHASTSILDNLAAAGPLTFNEDGQSQRRREKYDAVLDVYVFLWTVLTLIWSTGSCVGLMALLAALGAFYGKGVKNGFCAEWLWSREAGVKIEGILNVVRHILYLFLSWAVSSLFLGMLFLWRCTSPETIEDPRRAVIVDIVQEMSRKLSPGVLTAAVCIGWAPYFFLRYG